VEKEKINLTRVYWAIDAIFLFTIASLAENIAKTMSIVSSWEALFFILITMMIVIFFVKLSLDLVCPLFCKPKI